MKPPTLVALFALTPPLVGQALLHSHVLPPLWSVQRVAPAGDTNGDGVADVVVLLNDATVPSSHIPTLRVLSGQSLLPLWTTPDLNLAPNRDAFAAGDVNGDGRSDIVAVAWNSLRMYSGSNGTLLWSLPPSPKDGWAAACPIGDHDGNGSADLVVATYNSGAIQLRIRSGVNGSVLQTLGGFANNSAEISLRAVGDLNGDGKPEVARLTSFDLTMLHGTTGGVLWSVTMSGNDTYRHLEAIDLDGDGRREVFALRPGFSSPGVQSRVTVHAPTTGAVLLTLDGGPLSNYQDSVAPIGDLDSDGRQDFAIIQFTTLRATSGLDGHRLWPLASWIPGQGPQFQLALVGDIDGDGFGEFVTSLGNSVLPQSLHLLTAKVFAEAQPVQPACGGGPFFPQLGATRPMLGQPITIAGQNGPPGVPGLLVLSPQPAISTWLGFSTCYAHFDPTGGVVLAPLTQPQWSLSFPVPGAPQLAGLDVALQTWHTPTSGPRGNDLSNGVWARLGYP